MKRQKRFRASIYVDIFIDEEKEVTKEYGGQEITEYKDLEVMREEARQKVQEIVNIISIMINHYPDGVFNPYVGGVAAYEPRNLLKPLDKEI